MQTAMYVLLLMCISNGGKCEMVQRGDAYIVTGYHEQHMVGCFLVDRRSAYCYYSESSTGGWQSMALLPGGEVVTQDTAG